MSIFFFSFGFEDPLTLHPPHFTQPDFIADLKANIWNTKLGLVICSKLWHFGENGYSWIKCWLFNMGQATFIFNNHDRMPKKFRTGKFTACRLTNIWDTNTRTYNNSFKALTLWWKQLLDPKSRYFKSFDVHAGQESGCRYCTKNSVQKNALSKNIKPKGFSVGMALLSISLRLFQ